MSKIPPEAYTAAIGLLGVLVEQAIKWIAAKSGRDVDSVRADIRKELDDTEKDLASDRSDEHKRYDTP